MRKSSLATSMSSIRVVAGMTSIKHRCSEAVRSDRSPRYDLTQRQLDSEIFWTCLRSETSGTNRELTVSSLCPDELSRTGRQSSRNVSLSSYLVEARRFHADSRLAHSV